MPEQSKNGVTEDYIKSLLGLTQQVYDKRLQRETVAGLLEPITPQLVSFQASLTTLVSAQ